MNFIVIGEAVWAVSQNKQESDLFYTYHIHHQKLCEMRHELTHEYFSADWPSIWQTAKNDLPNLQMQFKKVLPDL